jgi:phospholipase C
MTGTSSGFVTNSPVLKWTTENTAETLFDRLDAHGRTWKVYVLEPARISFTGWIHMPRLKDRLATHFVPFSEFERDAANGTLPDFCLIEPHLVAGHGDYHPAEGRSLIGHDYNIAIDPPSSILAGENFLNRIYQAIKTADSTDGSNAYNTTFFIGWDEPGGTYDHLPPGPVPPPDSTASPGQCDFKFDRSGYRVPAIIVSPWIEEGTVVNDEYRHTSTLATLRKVWGLGAAFTARDAAARAFDHLLSRDTPRDPATWPDFQPQPVPEWQLTKVQLGEVLSNLGKAIGPGLIEHAKQSGLSVPALLADPDHPPTPTQLADFILGIAAKYFPRLVPDDTEEAQTYR